MRRGKKEANQSWWDIGGSTVPLLPPGKVREAARGAAGRGGRGCRNQKRGTNGKWNICLVGKLTGETTWNDNHCVFHNDIFNKMLPCRSYLKSGIKSSPGGHADAGRGMYGFNGN